MAPQVEKVVMKNEYRIVLFGLIALGATLSSRASADGGPSSTLFENQALFPGQGLVADTCTWHLDMQTDGNLVEYWATPAGSGSTESPATAVWSSQEAFTPGFNILSSPTTGLVAGSLAMLQTDGNFVWYTGPSLDPIWATGTNKGVADQLRMQDDGTVVVLNSSDLAVLWAEDPGRSSPVLSGPCPLTSHVTVLEQNYNRTGQNLSNQCTNEYAQCGEWCAANQACLNWTWTPPGDAGSCSATMGQCWLKDTQGTEVYAPTMISGVIQSYTPGIGNVTPGQASWPAHSQITGQGSGLCLDTTSEGTTMGSRVEIDPCNSSTTQIWTLNSAGELQQEASGLCLNVIEGATSEGSLLQLWTCTGTPNELWNLSLNGELEGAGSGLCLNVVGGATAAGTPVQLWSCAGTTPNEVWNAKPTWPAFSQITDAGSGLCLDSVNAESGSRVLMNTCYNESLTQLWTLNSAGELQQASSGLCLNVIGGATSQGSLLQLWSCAGDTPNELWSLNQGSELVGTGSGLCLNVVGGATTAGTPVQIWSCAGDTPNEVWSAQQSGELVGQGSGLCLNVYNGDTAPGSALIIFSCNGSTPNEVWTLNEKQEVVGMGSGLCLEVVDGGTGEGNNVDISTCTGASNQQWGLTPQGQLQGAESGLCLNVVGGATQSGSPLQIWPCQDTPNEVWTLKTVAPSIGLPGGFVGVGGGLQLAN
jgi:Ricin-type beta-trefoil lectin domain